jgi:hypothetical protein
MGFPNIYHIAPAILYLHPGITRDEYLTLLDGTHGSWNWHWGPGSEKIPLTFFDPKQDDKMFHSLHGLASLLCLDNSAGYIDHITNKLDENGITVRSPYYFPDFPDKGKICMFVHEKNEIQTEKRIEYFGGREIKVGYISSYEEISTEIPRAIVKEIHAKKFKGLKNYDDDGKWPLYKYDMTVIPFKKIERKEIYDSEWEMLKNWPILLAENMYDWSKNKGSFTDRIDTLPDFEWHKKDEKYYLDDSSLDKISATEYRQLILTAEAIKHSVWKPLTYKGFAWWNQFMNEYPDVRLKFEYAGNMAQLSESAKKLSMTHNQFLRSKILGDSFYNDFYDREIL